MGWAPEKAVSRDAMTNPESLDYFIEFARSSTDYDWRVPEAKR
jgi:acetoacetyl-CoA synthetase